MSTDAATATQSNRPIGITTPLGDDKLLLEQFTCSEGLSRPFRLTASVLAAPDYTVPFEQLLGQGVTVRLEVPGAEEKRYFNGLVYRITEGPKVHAPDTGKYFMRYWLEIMPGFVQLRNIVRSKTYQHQSVVDIIAAVLGESSISFSQRSSGSWDKRDYCVQYHESNFDFVSRLMEEEGIYYFFTHSDGSHQMVMGNANSTFADVPGGSTIKYSEFQGLRDVRLHEDRIYRWQKSQQMVSGKYTAWDYCFEEPAKNYEAVQQITSTASSGTITHHLKVGGNDSWEVYEYPGAYAQRYDGVDKGGSPQPSDLASIAQDNTRTAKIRMDQITAPTLLIEGESNVRRLIPGYKFTLDTHFNANGDYYLTDVEHSANMEGAYTTNESIRFRYKNGLRVLPSAIPYRPQRLTPRPHIFGTQTAVVVGSSGSEIETDKYGRVKIQFPWDRDGQLNMDSSCWVRVAQAWAGKGWGAFFLPRVNDEVIVAFEEGDPDKPIIVGCVYNATQIVPYTLPDNKTRSTIKTRSSTQGTEDNYNELRFEDKKDSEEIYFHAEKDFNRVVENNDTLKVGFDKKDKGNQTIEIYNDRSTRLQEGNETLTVEKGTRTVTVKQDDTHTVQSGSRTVTVNKNDTHEVQTGDLSVTVDQGNASYTISQGKCTISAQTSIEIKVGSTSIKLTPTGITMQATMIKLNADGMIQNQGGNIKIAANMALDMQGSMVKIN